MSNIKTISVRNFRNFDFFEISASSSAINLIVGPNGSGKTSLLEAISLIAPGKGLRNADFSDIVKYGADHWSIKSIIETNIGTFNINADHHQKGKNIYLDNARISHVELRKILSIISLTPQMNFVFSSIVERRKLLDRLVYYFDNEHSSRVHRYEYYIKERMKLLEFGSYDQSWMEIIETKISDAMIEIASARIKILHLFKSIIEKMETGFPKPIFEISGYVENNLDLYHRREQSLPGAVGEDFLSRAGAQAISGSSGDVFLYSYRNSEIATSVGLQPNPPRNDKKLSEYIKSILHQNRGEDLATKRTNFGTHRSDFIVKFAQKDIRAEFCSTGEQKALLVSIILAKTLATIEVFGATPVILLDEATTHLDSARQNELISFLSNLRCQIWISSTEHLAFEEYKINLINLS
jgi:DNA replication and repair protein RecF